MRELGWLESSFLSSDLTIVSFATIDRILHDYAMIVFCISAVFKRSDDIQISG
jgi:hypothetical protein